MVLLVYLRGVGGFWRNNLVSRIVAKVMITTQELAAVKALVALR